MVMNTDIIKIPLLNELKLLVKNLFKIKLRPLTEIMERSGKSSVNFLEKNNQQISDSVIKDVEVITDPQIIATSFTKYFNSIPGTLSESITNNNIPFRSYLRNATPEQPIFNPSEFLTKTKLDQL